MNSRPLFYEQAVIMAGDPTVAEGAGMIVLGEVRDAVTVDVNYEVFHGMVDRTGAVSLAGTGYTNGANPVASIPLIGNGLAQLEMLIATSTIFTDDLDVATDVIGYGADPRTIPVEDYFTLALVPRPDTAATGNGIDSKNATWFPRAMTTTFDAFTYDQPDSDDYLGDYAHNVEIKSAYHKVDQAGAVIPSELRRGFRGPVSDTTLGWTLPPYDGSV